MPLFMKDSLCVRLLPNAAIVLRRQEYPHSHGGAAAPAWGPLYDHPHHPHPYAQYSHSYNPPLPPHVPLFPPTTSAAPRYQPYHPPQYASASYRRPVELYPPPAPVGLSANLPPAGYGAATDAAMSRYYSDKLKTWDTRHTTASTTLRDHARCGSRDAV